MSESFVVAVTCVRRRPWAAPLWVGAMAAQSRRPDAVLVVVDEADSEDGTMTAWSQFLGGFEGHGLLRYPHSSVPGHSRTPDAEGRRYSDDQHAHLAALRNWTVARALELWPRATHIWSCDSDVAPDPDVLELLLQADKPVVGAVVRNSKSAHNFMCGWSHVHGEPTRDRSERTIGFLLGDESYPLVSHAPVPVTMTGACALYRADLFRGQGLGSMDRRDGFGLAAGCLRWAAHPRGEDVALAIQARELGIEQWLEPRARCAHWMGGPDEEPLR